MNMNKNQRIFFLLLSKVIIIALLLSSCTEGARKNLTPKPLGLGEMNEIVVIMDQDMWDGAIGDTVRFYYSSAFPILPQPEPIFDLRHFTADELRQDPLRRELRNYIVVADLEDENSSTTQMVSKDIGAEKVRKSRELPDYSNTVMKNRWAEGQVIIYLFGHGKEHLAENLKKNFPAVSKRVHQADEKKLNATVYLDGRNTAAEKEIMNTMGVEIKVPGEYDLVLNDSTVIWLRRETFESSSNIMLHKVKYDNEEQLSQLGIKAIRDSIGRYVSTNIENTYMQVNDVDLPMLTQPTEINGNYAVEARGIWEIANDFMGGSFVSYAILNEERTELLLADGFIHAPGKKKRNYMQYMEHALKTIDFPDAVQVQ